MLMNSSPPTTINLPGYINKCVLVIHVRLKMGSYQKGLTPPLIIEIKPIIQHNTCLCESKFITIHWCQSSYMQS